MFNYYRDEPNSVNTDDANPINVSISNSKSFDHKSDLNPELADAVNDINVQNNLEIAIPQKHLGNFWRSLNIPLINCEVSLKLSWTDKCVLVGRAYREANADVNPPIDLVNSPTYVKFEINNCKLYVPVVTLSTENENKFISNVKIRI